MKIPKLKFKMHLKIHIVAIYNTFEISAWQFTMQVVTMSCHVLALAL